VIDVLVVGGVFREILDFDSAPRRRIGGSGLTAAAAAHCVGASVALAGAVGSEDVDDVRGVIEAGGISDCLSVTAGRSGIFAYPTSNCAARPWPLYRPAEGPVTSPPELPNAKVLVLFGVPDLDPVAEGWVDLVSRDALVLWDRQGWLSRARDDAHILGLQAGARIYVANVAEAAEDAGADEGWALDHQPPPGYAAALIKRGSEGVIVYDATDRSEVPAFDVEATNAIGSGDAFAGAVAAVLASGGEVLAAARMGCAVAAAVVERGHNLADEATARRAEALMAGL
jgi:ribokinase